MKRAFFLAAGVALAMAGSARAAIDIHGADCGLHSDYGLGVEPDRLVFTRAGGTPAEIVIAHGTLRVDGRPLAVGPADRDRLLDLERGVRDALPDVKAIARDALAIAIDAVTEVSAAFAKDPESARASAGRLARKGRELDRRIADSDRFADWQDGDVERFAGDLAGTLAAEVAGSVAGQAISVALSGDGKAAAELEARADGIEKNVDRVVERRSRALEARASGLCARLHRLAGLETALDVRLEDGRPLGLVRDGR